MAKTPVVFVPGLGGSFNLLELLDWRPAGLSGWDFPPFIDYGRAFVDAFARAGYARDRDLFVAFYDWRKSVADSAITYLIPWIDRAKASSGSQQVVLVGHSMGGLVARSYIQGNAYRQDVARLITLGTPHRGAADSYYPWEGGDITWGPVAEAVFGVYLWYLEHAHLFQTKLNRLLTIRTQAPGVRDLLPVFDYVQRQGAPALLAAGAMQQRNLLGDLLMAPAGTAQLLARTPVTTQNGTGFATLQSLVVGVPAANAEPPPYVDGQPIEKRTSTAGDGTVLLSSAAIDDPRARNLPPLPVAHDELPDKAVAQVLAELNIALPSLPPAPAPVTRLVVLSASPLVLTVEPPAPAPAVLSDTPAARRPARPVRAKNYGHRDKRLNMAIIPDPLAGAYRVRLRGTASGTFALGALLIGPRGAAVLADDESSPAPRATPIATAQGRVAAETELFYQVDLAGPGAAPQIRFDAGATARDALARLGAATQAPHPAVLSDTATPPALPRVLADLGVEDDLGQLVRAALAQGDAAAAEQLAARLATADREALSVLGAVLAGFLGTRDPQLALGLAEQLRQVALAGRPA